MRTPIFVTVIYAAILLVAPVGAAIPVPVSFTASCGPDSERPGPYCHVRVTVIVDDTSFFVDQGVLIFNSTPTDVTECENTSIDGSDLTECNRTFANNGSPDQLFCVGNEGYVTPPGGPLTQFPWSNTPICPPKPF